jgi:hypothetical protein
MFRGENYLIESLSFTRLLFWATFISFFYCKDLMTAEESNEWTAQVLNKFIIHYIIETIVWKNNLSFTKSLLSRPTNGQKELFIRLKKFLYFKY